ncbi:hypothetical protein BESB_059020 [Besnoitia besnoiti]|uniref:Uncharacterized protein n=1 Tax=Besnoitia besnoiti TaxID=94643 RepID=A0A2A9MAK4_BESBE|nr:hypothetical protein BESB_059020 [Besnoitia besnoiti]PFH35015.1 hypothetical protein BESB_059020 [Besnoitia besnoiti]
MLLNDFAYLMAVPAPSVAGPVDAFPPADRDAEERLHRRRPRRCFPLAHPDSPALLRGHASSVPSSPLTPAGCKACSLVSPAARAVAPRLSSAGPSPVAAKARRPEREILRASRAGQPRSSSHVRLTRCEQARTKTPLSRERQAAAAAAAEEKRRLELYRQRLKRAEAKAAALQAEAARKSEQEELQKEREREQREAMEHKRRLLAAQRFREFEEQLEREKMQRRAQQEVVQAARAVAAMRRLEEAREAKEQLDKVKQRRRELVKQMERERAKAVRAAELQQEEKRLFAAGIRERRRDEELLTQASYGCAASQLSGRASSKAEDGRPPAPRFLSSSTLRRLQTRQSDFGSSFLHRQACAGTLAAALGQAAQPDAGPRRLDTRRAARSSATRSFHANAGCSDRPQRSVSPDVEDVAMRGDPSGLLFTGRASRSDTEGRLGFSHASQPGRASAFPSGVCPPRFTVLRTERTARGRGVRTPRSSPQRGRDARARVAATEETRGFPSSPSFDCFDAPFFSPCLDAAEWRAGASVLHTPRVSPCLSQPSYRSRSARRGTGRVEAWENGVAVGFWNEEEEEFFWSGHADDSDMRFASDAAAEALPGGLSPREFAWCVERPLAVSSSPSPCRVVRSVSQSPPGEAAPGSGAGYEGEGRQYASFSLPLQFHLPFTSLRAANSAFVVGDAAWNEGPGCSSPQALTLTPFASPFSPSLPASGRHAGACCEDGDSEPERGAPEVETDGGQSVRVFACSHSSACVCEGVATGRWAVEADWGRRWTREGQSGELVIEEARCDVSAHDFPSERCGGSFHEFSFAKLPTERCCGPASCAACSPPAPAPSPPFSPACHAGEFARSLPAPCEEAEETPAADACGSAVAAARLSGSDSLPEAGEREAEDGEKGRASDAKPRRGRVCFDLTKTREKSFFLRRPSADDDAAEISQGERPRRQPLSPFSASSPSSWASSPCVGQSPCSSPVSTTNLTDTPCFGRGGRRRPAFGARGGIDAGEGPRGGDEGEPARWARGYEAPALAARPRGGCRASASRAQALGGPQVTDALHGRPPWQSTSDPLGTPLSRYACDGRGQRSPAEGEGNRRPPSGRSDVGGEETRGETREETLSRRRNERRGSASGKKIRDFAAEVYFQTQREALAVVDACAGAREGWGGRRATSLKRGGRSGKACAARRDRETPGLAEEETVPSQSRLREAADEDADFAAANDAGPSLVCSPFGGSCASERDQAGERVGREDAGEKGDIPPARGGLAQHSRRRLVLGRPPPLLLSSSLLSSSLLSSSVLSSSTASSCSLTSSPVRPCWAAPAGDACERADALPRASGQVAASAAAALSGAVQAAKSAGGESPSNMARAWSDAFGASASSFSPLLPSGVSPSFSPSLSPLLAAFSSSATSSCSPPSASFVLTQTGAMSGSGLGACDAVTTPAQKRAEEPCESGGERQPPALRLAARRPSTSSTGSVPRTHERAGGAADDGLLKGREAGEPDDDGPQGGEEDGDEEDGCERRDVEQRGERGAASDAEWQAKLEDFECRP